MPQLTERTTYDDVMRSFSWARLWALFDGDRERMNLAVVRNNRISASQARQSADHRDA